MKHPTLVEEVADMVVVSCDPVIMQCSEHWPSVRGVQERFSLLGIRAPVPEAEDPFWAEVRAKVAEWRPKLRAAAMQEAERVLAFRQQKVIHMDIDSNTKISGTADEARIKGMTSLQARELCTKHGIALTVHPTNAGITAMRAKNALAKAVSEGKITLENPGAIGNVVTGHTNSAPSTFSTERKRAA